MTQEVITSSAGAIEHPKPSIKQSFLELVSRFTTERYERNQANQYVRKSVRHLKGQGESIGPLQKEQLQQFFTGYFQGERWLMQRIHFDFNRILEVRDNSPRNIMYAKDADHILLDPRQLLRRFELADGSQPRREEFSTVPLTNADTVVLNTYDSLSPRQLGQAYGIEELVHTAQWEGLKDNKRHLQSIVFAGNGLSNFEYRDQAHEKEAIAYVWIFFEETVGSANNPFTKLAHLLKINTEELRKSL